MDGMTVLEAMRGDDRTRHIPVLILSNYGEPPLIERGLRLGAREYLLKSETTPSGVAARARTYTGRGAVQDGKRVPAADSAVYDLGHSRWSPAGAVPPPRDTWCLDGPGCVGVDTGSRVVFAGQGLAWDPSGDRWSVIAAGPFADPHLEGKAAAWTGSRVMLWGGGTTTSPGDVPPATVNPGGSAYDPAADRWEPLPAAPLTPRARAAAVWTGREFIVCGGEGDENHRAQFDDGAAYTP